MVPTGRAVVRRYLMYLRGASGADLLTAKQATAQIGRVTNQDSSLKGDTVKKTAIKAGFLMVPTERLELPTH